MVRLGIGLYGISSVNEFRDKLRSVVTLKSRISQIKTVSKGESVGYGRNFIAPNELNIATVAIGYADGLVRKLGNGNWYFRIKDQKAPIIGNVCMDMTMVDITGIEDVREKDEVIVFEGNEDIYKMAEKRETIAYEILTSLSERVKRIFFYGD
jgi:alanine racemase